MVETTDFNTIRISLASPEEIRSWSYGEVTKPETLNYRTLRPEKDGLFCEKTFGPTKDWECSCGKYKKIRYRGVRCDRCGVEVTRAKVRRERMAHISLAAPVAHIWFAKGVPSRMALLLDLSPRNLERVLYFAQYVITKVDEEARREHLEEIHKLLERLEKQDAQEPSESLETEGDTEQSIPTGPDKEPEDIQTSAADHPDDVAVPRDPELEKAQRYEELQSLADELEDLRIRQLLTESRYRELHTRHGEVFQAGMGAEAILDLLGQVDAEAEREFLRHELQTTSGQRRRKAIKRLRVVEAFHKSSNMPEWMILKVLPVLPPDLRPMVQLDGGRFATSDLNDLYRRVINRNSRLKRLLELGAPEIIIRNEKRMLQEAVDALIDNGRRGRVVSGTHKHKHKLKSLADLLRGKQGRFRQNLLGKRVDYSGRTVIVVGPELQLHQCGLPKRMALELFKPLVMNRMAALGYAHNIKGAKRMVERVRPEVWDLLEEVIRDRPVLLNRAPTLHRLGVQAFQPVLIEGSAIQVHPLVCTSFNADFDGDQMAVHVPLSREAVREAQKIMLSTYNMLAPSSGEPVVAPTLDMVLGCFYLTIVTPGVQGEGTHFADYTDAHQSYDHEQIHLQAEILIRDSSQPDGWLRTTVGRIIFNEVFPPEIDYWNSNMDKNTLKEVVAYCYRVLGSERTAHVLDQIKYLGFHYATRSGISISIRDLEVVAAKPQILSTAEKKLEEMDQQYDVGLITAEERYSGTVRLWQEANEQIRKAIEKSLVDYGGIYMMATSGAKGNIAQITQMAGMRGLMSNPRGQIIELPVKSSFREGLSVLEYFISTHGARKGLTDTALRTADSGYLTRRLIDVSQDVIVLIGDCETLGGIWVDQQQDDPLLPSFRERVLGRLAAAPIIGTKDGKVLVERNDEIDEDEVTRITDGGVARILVRSPMTCQAPRGVCQACYGRSPATGRQAMIGEAVGIIAAQSIGEPGTQLTMRTFHTGGVAQEDITTGLPRVEELFEARAPKNGALQTEIDGLVEIIVGSEGRVVRIATVEEYHDEVALPSGISPTVKDGTWVEVGTPLASKDIASSSGSGEEEPTDLEAADDQLVAKVAGKVHLEGDRLVITWEEEEVREYSLPHAAHLVVENQQQVRAGDSLTSGNKNPHEILRIQGREAVQKYLVEEVQRVYRAQGVTTNDKHTEIIVGQMLRKVRLDSVGDTDLLPGELVDRTTYEELNAKVLAEGGEPATAQPMLLGVTRASLATYSFLAAASFQETARVLTEAAVNGAVDRLYGLKENVIIGRLIPARLDRTEDGKQMVGFDEIRPSQELVGSFGGEISSEPSSLEDFLDTSFLTGVATSEEPDTSEEP